MSSVKKNIVWSLSSNILPLLVGLILFPKIIAAYGLEQFGILTLVWALIGYFSLFDLGLSRALTQQVSNYIAKDKSNSDIAQLIRTGFISMWLLGIVGGLALWLCSPSIIHTFLKIPESLQDDSLQAFALLSLSIPLVVHTAALRAVLEALHLFKSASIIRTILGIGSFLAPYLAGLLSPTLTNAVISLIATRAFVWALHLYAVHHSKILSAKTSLFNLGQLKPMLHFGSWMTISNIISPLMVYMDRFVVAGLLGVAATSYYVAPYEVITKLLVIPAAFSGVLFPIFSKQWQKDPVHSAHLLKQGFSYTLLLLFPISVLAVFFSKEWLSIWLNPEFALQARLVVSWLTIGVLINSTAQIIFAKVQGAGRSDWTAKLHLAEVLPYLAFLYISLYFFGIAGAAFAWCLRVTIDLVGLLIFSKKINPASLRTLRPTLWTLMIAVCFLLPSIFDASLTIRIIEVILILLAYSWVLHRELRSSGLLDKIKHAMQSQIRKHT
ncbi:flippase [Polynucleobacter sp. UB-Raua-W9]|uniref:flippase n=1 Tax=Polynucleobacter sp. UB-Raua-W9 TaxID=1819736 RepID=UPI001BFE444D|nr:flippase [Polynucleobacter sp. UB-Raua-W9]QWD72714.1 flippase [Polynucleobacter sp. UB-Raua-W9]